MNDPVMVILRWRTEEAPDRVLGRYSRAADLWRELHPQYVGPVQTFAGRVGDDLVVVNVFATDDDHLQFGRNMGRPLEEAGLPTPEIEHVRLFDLGEREGTGRAPYSRGRTSATAN